MWEEKAAAESKAGKAVAISWSTAFKAAKSRKEAEEVVCNCHVDEVFEVLLIEKVELDIARALSHYSLDLLVAIGIRGSIMKTSETHLRVLELLASGSIHTLEKAICAKSKIVPLVQKVFFVLCTVFSRSITY